MMEMIIVRMVLLFQIFGPSLVPLLSKTGPLFGPSEGLFGGGTRLVITAYPKTCVFENMVIPEGKVKTSKLIVDPPWEMK